MKKAVKVILILIPLLFLIVIGGTIGYVLSQTSPVSKSETEEPVRFEVEYGTSVYTISMKLKELNLIKNQKIFYYSLRYPKLIQKICPNEPVPDKIEFKSGIYYLNPSMNYAQIINNLSSGRQEYIKVSIPEGLTISKIGELLQENNICKKEDYCR